VIGTVMTIGGIAGMLMTAPAGALSTRLAFASSLKPACGNPA
jgi:hypothetical protein